MKKISIIGSLIQNRNAYNGQAVKTQIFADTLIDMYGQKEVLLFDTHGGWQNFIYAPLFSLKALYKSLNVLIFPAQNGVRVFVPLLSVLRFLFFRNRKLHYVVIGGWLPEFLKRRKLLTSYLKHFNGIYVETTTMKFALESKGFTNVYVVPNCKNLKILSPEKIVYSVTEPFKLCTFSRVMKEKGIEDAISAVRAVNEKYNRIVCTLTIYGQVESSQIEWFENLTKTFPNYVTYGGVVSYDQSTAVLKDYAALLFPTYYDGEGFAGTIIDALAAGVPVVASDWKYNTEFVKDYYTGRIYHTHNNTELLAILEEIAFNQIEWNKMKVASLREAHNYLPGNVVPLLTEHII